MWKYFNHNLIMIFEWKFILKFSYTVIVNREFSQGWGIDAILHGDTVQCLQHVDIISRNYNPNSTRDTNIYLFITRLHYLE